MARLLQLNINGIRSKNTILADYLQHWDIDLALICETKYSPDSRSSSIPGYITAARHEPANGGGGTAVLVRRGLSITSIETSHLQNDCAAVRVRLPGIGDVAIVCIYVSPTSSIHSNTFSFFLDRFPKAIIMGDFNAFHLCISDLTTHSNSRGDQLYQLITSFPLQIINSNSAPTRIDVHHGTPSLLDLILMTDNISHYVSEHFVGEDVGSDHLPVHLLLQDTTRPPVEVTLRRNLEKANWNRFKDLTEQHFRDLRDIESHPPESLQEVDDICNSVSSAITQALDVVAPLKPVKHRTFTLSESTLELIREKRRARRQVQRQPNSEILRHHLNRLGRQVKSAVAAEKRQQWRDACSDLDYRDGSAFWKQFKRLTASGSRTQTNLRVNDPQGNLTADDESTAQVLADHLARCHTPNSGPHFNQEVFTEVTNLIRDDPLLFTPQLQQRQEEGDDHDLMAPITSETVTGALQRTKNTSPGEDKVTYKIIKKCHPLVYRYLAKLYSLLRNIGYFPRAWKSAIGVMIPKPGKDCKIPGNNRPISLLYCVGKLFEKCISRPLIDHLVNSQLLNKWQRAYLPRKEANEHIFRFATHIRSSLDLGWSSAAILLDVEKAFDSVWQDGLRFKLSQSHLPRKITRLLSSFLEGRTIAVRVGNTVSRQVPLMAGTPQGSVLSPILFNIFVNDLPFPADNKVQISQFADDLAFWTSSRSRTRRGFHLIQKDLQDCMKKLEDWCSTWHIKMNPAKSQLLFFTNRMSWIPEAAKEVLLFGTPIPVVTEAKLLGLTFTAPRFKLLKHCKNLREKAESRIRLLRSIRGTQWGASVPTLLHLYKSFIRPVLETGYVATFHADKHALHHLVVAENKALRIALKQFYTPGESRTTNAELYRLYGEPTILERLRHLNCNALDRIGGSPLCVDLDRHLDHMAWHRRRVHPRVARYVVSLIEALEAQTEY